MFQILSTPLRPLLHSHCLLRSHERISLPTLQSLCATGGHICLSWIVPIPLQHRNQLLGSPTQSCMQGYYWVPLFHPLLLLEAQLPPLKLTLEHQALSFFECALRPRPLQPQCPGNKKRTLSIKEETFLEIILFFGHTITPIPT